MFDGFVVLDIETTGLDPALDSILEVGILVIDKRFEKIAEFSEVCYFDFELSKSGIDGFVQNMHENNGLWAECAKSQRGRPGIEREAIKFLTDGGWAGQPMTGSTINFDRSFLQMHMPTLEKTFHYRNIDISTLKGLFNKFKWDVNKPKSEDAHRALPDCYDSAAELRAYVKAMGAAFDAMEWADNHDCNEH